MAQKRVRQKKRIKISSLLIAKTYGIAFGVFSVGYILILFIIGQRSWFFILYLIATGSFIYALLMILSKGQPKKHRSDLIQELDETKSYMQQIQLQKKQEQLNALQSQINPHFLYNTLDTIRGLAIEKESMEIANIVAALASMFKYSVDYASTNVSMSDEVAHLKKYLDIQKIRFKNRFDVAWIYECEQDVLYRVNVPKLTLQPIIENAITHGLKNRFENGLINMRFVLSDVSFKVIISDNGSGMPEDVVIASNKAFSKPNLDSEPTSDLSQSGIALANINTRIKFYFGAEYGLFVASTLGIGTEVTVTLPAPEGDQ